MSIWILVTIFLSWGLIMFFHLLQNLEKVLCKRNNYYFWQAGCLSFFHLFQNLICLISTFPFSRLFTCEWELTDLQFKETVVIAGFHMITKIQTTKLSILLRFYFHGVLEQLKTNFQTNFRFKRVLGFVIEYAWISMLLRDAAFTWRPRELSCRLKKWLISGNFAI